MKIWIGIASLVFATPLIADESIPVRQILECKVRNFINLSELKTSPKICSDGLLNSVLFQGQHLTSCFDVAVDAATRLNIEILIDGTYDNFNVYPDLENHDPLLGFPQKLFVRISQLGAFELPYNTFRVSTLWKNTIPPFFFEDAWPAPKDAIGSLYFPNFEVSMPGSMGNANITCRRYVVQTNQEM